MELMLVGARRLLCSRNQWILDLDFIGAHSHLVTACDRLGASAVEPHPLQPVQLPATHNSCSCKQIWTNRWAMESKPRASLIHACTLGWGRNKASETEFQRSTRGTTT